MCFASMGGLSADDPRVTNNTIGIRLVPIAPGTFTMGQDGPPVAGNGDMATHHAEFRAADWDEKPAHRVTITRPFSMAATEVTVAQYRRFDPNFGKEDPRRRPAS
jgi:formylglycine-generating enzyme required for sulfatase activity